MRHLPALRLLVTAAWLASAQQAVADEQSLRAAFVALRERLDDNPFHRPLHLESVQRDERSQGDIHAVLTHPFVDVKAALAHAAAWCDILILHPTTKQCRPRDSAKLAVHIGRKLQQSSDGAHRVDFDFTVRADDARYLQVALGAAGGPFGTHDYHITLQAIPLDDGRSFVHLSYSYGYGIAARLAMQAYLNTVARDKVGFSVEGHDARGQPVYVGSVRGAIERNAMRYYLAIDAHLHSMHAAAPERDEQRLRHWYAATARHAQLKEDDEAEYLEVKRREIRRQRDAHAG